MSEAEVSVRLALYLLRNRIAVGEIAIAIDGAQVQTGGTVHFALAQFLADSGCSPITGNKWQGRHKVTGCDFGIRVHSRPGEGDVVAKLATGGTLRVESKKGPLARSKSSQEYPLLREAIGQLMTVEEIEPDDMLAVAVPHSDKFAELAARWRDAPLMKRLGIRLLTVDREGHVFGFNALSSRGDR